ncbi:hypothetical protein [Erythrobacter ani]|uniref:Uncharacterized protein n=1 Tax=Erythrobacter ani TaxID=2827235 RepID=A0ABS6SMY3_9SPHN|nr:hypothetical protein [Erythrobacter ani]MBV7266396.1 hypothetical protein [Erythrobacter ani]
MAWFFQSGHAGDLILLVLAGEALWLRLRGWRWAEIAGLLGPAVLIVLGLRAALVGAEWYWVAAPLALSLPLHLFDLRMRAKAHR